MIQYCFEELESTSKDLVADLENEMHTDRIVLSAIANIITEDDLSNEDTLCSILNSIDQSNSYISYYEILLPDNELLKQDGVKVDTSGQLDFEKEITKGSYISQMEYGIIDSEEKVIRNAVPVVYMDHTIAILYGVISLEEFADKYKTDIYDGNAYVYLEDGRTGDFLLDTWHKTLGNIEDFNDRKTAPGYNFEQAISDMNQGRSGNICFVSESTGKTIYLHYQPVGINGWNVMLSIDEESAFRKTNVIRRTLYIMSAIVGIVLILYMTILIFWMRKMYKSMHKLDIEDRTTKIQNRNAYDRYVQEVQAKIFDQITCVYIDGNGLHEINNKYGHLVGDQMLRTIAMSLKEEFGYHSLYRIGGDEFVVICDDFDYEICSKKWRL